MSESISWEELRTEFKIIRDFITGIRFATDDEIDCYKASLVAPRHVHNRLGEMLLDGRRYPPLKGEKRSRMLDEMLISLGSNQLGSLPEHIGAAIQNEIKFVEGALNREALSTDFIRSWGEIHKAFGAVGALLEGDDLGEKDFRRGMKSVKDVEPVLQKYWYAHWITEHGVLRKGADRPALEDELADLCGDIVRGEREARVHEKQWFEELIARNPADPESWMLKTTYTRCSRREIRRMAKNSLIPLSALPPLSLEEF